MQSDSEKDPANVAAVINNRNGTFTVLRCKNKEHPEGYRGIVGRFYLSGRRQALNYADRIEGGKVR